jgi:peptidyl-prolyl cis-trans isomerase B (cyclophilin B)
VQRLSVFLIGAALLASLVGGCGQTTPEPGDNVPSTNTPGSAPNEPVSNEPEANRPAEALNKPAEITEGMIEGGADGVPKTAPPNVKMPKPGEKVAVIQTNMGDIWVRFFPDKAPKHVANFIDLAGKGFFEGTKFHRVIPDFMIQGGDPNSKDSDRSDDGTGGNVVDGKEVNVPAEFTDLKHTRGILSAARSSDPNSASSQFFIVVADNPGLDGQYSAYGMAFAGMDVADKIVNLPRDMNDNPLEQNPAIVLKVTVLDWDEKYLKKEGA